MELRNLLQNPDSLELFLGLSKLLQRPRKRLVLVVVGALVFAQLQNIAEGQIVFSAQFQGLVCLRGAVIDRVGNVIELVSLVDQGQLHGFLVPVVGVHGLRGFALIEVFFGLLFRNWLLNLLLHGHKLLHVGLNLLASQTRDVYLLGQLDYIAGVHFGVLRFRLALQTHCPTLFRGNLKSVVLVFEGDLLDVFVE